MADYFPASIAIGGPITPAGVEALIAAVLEDGPNLGEGDGPAATEAGLRDAIAAATAAEVPLVLADFQARYGQFEATEAACRAAGLSYLRRNDGIYEYDAGIEWWRPDGAGIACIDTTQSGKPLLPLDELGALLAADKPEDAILADVRALVIASTPPEVPPLTAAATPTERTPMPIFRVRLLSPANIVLNEDDDQGPSDVRDAVEDFLAAGLDKGDCIEVTCLDPAAGVVDRGDGTFIVQGAGGDPRAELAGLLREFLTLDPFADLLAVLRAGAATGPDFAARVTPLTDLLRRADLAARIHGTDAGDAEDDD